MTEDIKRLVEALAAIERAEAALNVAESHMLSKGWWTNEAGYLTDAALWITQGRQALAHHSAPVRSREAPRSKQPGVDVSDPAALAEAAECIRADAPTSAPVACSRCGGSGKRAGGEWNCEACEGTGTPVSAPVEDVGELAKLPPDVIAALRAAGRVEWGATAEKMDGEHLEDFARTLRITRENFDTPDETALQGVYLEGTETVVCHTGTSPNSAQHARIIVGLWNRFADLAALIQPQGEERS